MGRIINNNYNLQRAKINKLQGVMKRNRRCNSKRMQEQLTTTVPAASSSSGSGLTKLKK
jgi:hypothetical protein